MKLLIENWRSFVNEEDEQTEGETSVSQADIDALFDDHASGRPFDAETEKVLDSGATINEVETTEEGYDVVLQDFIAIHNNIDSEIANENSALSQLEKIASKEAFTKYVDKAAANLKRDVTEIGNLSDLINTGKFPNYKRVEVDGKIRFINTGFKRARRYGRYETSEEVARDRLEDLNNRYTELVDKILRILTIIKRVLTSAFGDNTDRIENYYKAVSAIKLFTGESVATVRKPEGFKPEKAKLISNSSRMLKNIVETLQGLDIVPRPYLPEFKSVYEDKNRAYLDLKTEIGMMARNITPTKFDYEFAKGFLTYTGKNSPVLFVQQGTTIYRGVNADEAKYLKYKNMESGTIKAYHDIVSWSADMEVARSFAMGEDDTRKAKPFAIILRTKATRGIYVEEYSKYPNEKEVICGGNIVLVSKDTFRLPDTYGTMREGLILDFEYV
jgi:hypothetical protein